MLNPKELQILEQSLLYNKKQLNYYLVLAVLLIILSLGLYFALRRTGVLITALIVCAAIWIYPWRYYKKVKSLHKDLKEQQKVTLVTSVYGKGISKINRLKPYYYIYTDDHGEYELNQSAYMQLNEGDKIRLSFLMHSKTIIDLKKI